MNRFSVNGDIKYILTYVSIATHANPPILFIVYTNAHADPEHVVQTNSQDNYGQLDKI
jgi:hypothetical protein